MASTATRTRRHTRSSVRPQAAAAAIDAAVTVVPAATASSPARPFSPRRRTFAPAAIGPKPGGSTILSARPPDCSVTSSRFTTASLPAGSGAPVKMRTAAPGGQAGAGAPAAAVPHTGSDAGAE